MSIQQTIPIAKISFDPIDEKFEEGYIWNRYDFREFLHSVNKDKRLNKMWYIVTQGTDTNIINQIAVIFNIPTANVFYTTSEAQKEGIISQLGVDFHFDGDSGVVDDLNTQLTGRVPKFTAFYVNFIRDEYTQMMKYIDRFRFELNIFLNNNKYNKFD
jgi:hypothetical protein